MTDATLLYNNAELAFVAYSNLTRGNTTLDSNREGLIDVRGAGMSPTQATEFAKRFPTIVAQFNDTPAEGGMSTSFRDRRAH